MVTTAMLAIVVVHAEVLRSGSIVSRTDEQKGYQFTPAIEKNMAG